MGTFLEDGPLHKSVGSSDISIEGGSISLESIEGGPASIDHQSSPYRTLVHRRGHQRKEKSNEDITCTFICKRNGACSHRTDNSTYWIGGTCVKRGKTTLVL